MSRVVSEAYHQAKLAEAHRQIAALQETVLDLRRKLLKPSLRFPNEWGLWRSEDHVLGVLIDAAPEAVGRERLAIAFAERTDRRNGDDYVRQRIHFLRKKLAQLGFGDIKPRYCVGYYLTAADAAQIKLAAARAFAACRSEAVS
ncbi:hypothetical protein [Rhodopseudomonas palustris]|uniref:hypothetical protein n=1 Tax=Rhodopseudomonas palustris TaxID=1076 RepID=UPI001403621B|nr:hypothetical protein [Rhodopseudomonas palustris]